MPRLAPNYLAQLLIKHSQKRHGKPGRNPTEYVKIYAQDLLKRNNYNCEIDGEFFKFEVIGISALNNLFLGNMNLRTSTINKISLNFKPPHQQECSFSLPDAVPAFKLTTIEDSTILQRRNSVKSSPKSQPPPKK